MPERKTCKICGNKFDTSNPKQRVCPNPSCQHQRQLENMQAWRKNNPDYFKYSQSDEVAVAEVHRRYIREYMRKYRKRINKSVNKK